MEQGNKRLVVCCNGTWNEPDQKAYGNPADELESGARYADGPLPSFPGCLDFDNSYEGAF